MKMLAAELNTRRRLTCQLLGRKYQWRRQHASWHLRSAKMFRPPAGQDYFSGSGVTIFLLDDMAFIINGSSGVAYIGRNHDLTGMLQLSGDQRHLGSTIDGFVYTKCALVVFHAGDAEASTRGKLSKLRADTIVPAGDPTVGKTVAPNPVIAK